MPDFQTICPVSSLRADHRHGQVFLTWREADVPPGSTFSVYAHHRPITADTLSSARLIAHHIEPHSARDWWLDPASFNQETPYPPATPVGFIIEDHAAPLDPASGLFVATIAPDHQGPTYHAVLLRRPDGTERPNLILEQNSLASPIDVRPAPTRPIWLGPDAAYAFGAGNGKRLVLNLHGRGNGRTVGKVEMVANYLAFGSRDLGWREGLSFKFRVEITADAVEIRPSDRVWIGRPLLESYDARDHYPAVNTWWYGYNSNIFDPARMSDGVVVNYSQRRLIWLIRWAQEYLGADANRTYLVGGSMGGSGAVFMALHHPHLFAAVRASVPIVAYTQPGAGSAKRLEPYCGLLDRATTDDGTPMLDHMNGPRLASQPIPPSPGTPGEASGNSDCPRAGWGEGSPSLPFLMLCNGRKDGSIPWENNPAFYRALQAGRHGFVTHWNHGAHGQCQKLLPPDAQNWEQQFYRLRLDESFPAFSNASTDRNPGNGDASDGDIEGWMNRGLDWRDIVDQEDRYEISITADCPALGAPLTVDLTPRRRQHFRPSPGQRLRASVNGREQPLTVDASGLFTLRQVPITADQPTRIAIVAD